jgi:hypothetical protein
MFAGYTTNKDKAAEHHPNANCGHEIEKVVIGKISPCNKKKSKGTEEPRIKAPYTLRKRKRVNYLLHILLTLVLAG